MEAETRRILERFMVNAETVGNSNWLKAIKQRGLKIQFRWSVGQPLTVSTTAPTGDELVALVAILRKFELGREPASFNTLEKKVLNDPSISPEWKENFVYVKKDWNEFKDAPSQVGENLKNPALTSRLLIDTFIYGGLFHDDEEKVRLLEIWKSHPGYIVIENDYHFALLQLWKCVAFLYDMTKLELAGEPVPPVSVNFETEEIPSGEDMAILP